LRSFLTTFEHLQKSGLFHRLIPPLINATNRSKKLKRRRKRFFIGLAPLAVHRLESSREAARGSSMSTQNLIESAHKITERLIAWSNGDAAALDDVITAVYQELRRMADRYLRKERLDHTLQTTALVHEAYLRLIDQTHVSWQNRAQFFAIAAQMMRRILVDHARTRQRDKRGGAAQKLSLDEVINLAQGDVADIVALDDALKALAEIDQRKSRVVELRFFGGLNIEETAEVLGVSTQTVVRDLRLSKAWLYQEIKRGADNDS
jgi:RNA polymerase sigma-70 factor (ECF subfamily)